MSETVPVYDYAGFTTEPYSQRIEKPWGYEVHLTPQGLAYMMKIIHVEAGMRLSHQLHDEKQETWTLLNGPGYVIWQNNTGQLEQTWLIPGQGYTCAVGQPHRLGAGPSGPAKFLESSTRESGTTYRIEDDFARPHETPEQRTVERGEPVI